MHRTGLARRRDDSRCGGSRSATPAITCTSWRRWPARTGPGRGSGTTSTGSARRARPWRSGSGCAARRPETAPRPGGRPGRRRSRPRGAAGPSRPASRLRRQCAPRRPEHAPRRSSSPRSTDAGVLVRKRYSTIRPGEVTGYAVGLPQHTARGGGPVWYGGGKLAADLTLPKLRRRWAGTASADRRRGMGCRLRRRAPCSGTPSPAPRSRRAASRSSSRGCARPGSGCGCGSARSIPARSPGTRSPCPATTTSNGQPLWHSGGRLSGELTLPRLRRRWPADGSAGAERSGAGAGHRGSFRFTAAERDAIFEHAARQAAIAAEHIRRCAERDPADGGRRGVGGGRHAACRGAGHRQPGAAPGGRRLRPGGPRTLRPHPRPHRATVSGSAPPPGAWR